MEEAAILQADGLSNKRKKIIIDADPGIDDAMAIFMALRSPDLEIVGITTIFGNAPTSLATRNALHLLRVAGADEIPVAEGSHQPLKGGQPQIQEFANGSDGLGNITLNSDEELPLKKTATNACDFLVDKVLEFPGEITIVALGPLTNLAQAFSKHKSLAEKIQHVLVSGGAIFSSGNMNPASEANMYGDPEAADIVFTSGAHITAIGMNVTSQVILDECDLSMLSDSRNGYRKCLYDMSMFYKEWHFKSDRFDGVFAHGPVCLAALISPSCFTYKTGSLRVETTGICRGHTLFDMGLKRWNTTNPWNLATKFLVDVAWTIDPHKVLQLIRERLIQADSE